MANPNDRKLVSDKMLGRLTGKISNGDMVSENKNEGFEDSDIVVLYEEIKKTQSMLKAIQRSVRSIIREEFDELLDNTTIITEGKANEMHIVLGSLHLKGNVKPVVKKK